MQHALFDATPQPRRRTRPPSALTRKSNGQWLAAAMAGQKWAEDAMLALGRFFLHLRRTSVHAASSEVLFTFEQFRIYCAVHRLPEPASVNAWGSLPRRAVAAGLCRWSGSVATGTRPESHGRLLKVWEVV